MKVYRYVSPAWINADDSIGPTLFHTYSEDRILQYCWDYWQAAMLKVNKGHLISKENCIKDWVTTNWAWEVKEKD